MSELMFRNFDMNQARLSAAYRQERRNRGNIYVINTEVSELYFSVQGDSFFGLAQVVIGVEEDNDWGRLLGGASATEIEEPVPTR